MNNLKTIAAGVFLAAGLASPSATAQDESSFPGTRLIETIDHATFVAVLDDIDAAWSTDQIGDGTTVYAITFESGLKSLAYFRACDDGNANCKGLALVSEFGAPDDLSDAELNDKVNTFNDSYPAGKAFRSSGRSVLVQSYVITDFGITMANLRIQTIVFVDICQAFRDSFEEG